MGTKTRKPVQVESNPTVSLPISLIHADPEFNARKVYTGRKGSKDKDAARGQQSIEELADSIKKEGMLLQPVIVRERPNGDGYDLLVGFRRFKAVKEILEQTTIDCRLIEVKDDLDAYMVNLVENESRNDLLPWEAAFRFHELKKKFEKTEHKLTEHKLAARVGRSRSYVSNLIRICDKVHPKILKIWPQEGTPDYKAKKVCTVSFLMKCIPLTHEEQWTLYQVAAGLIDESGSEITPPTPTKRGAQAGEQRPPGKKHCEKALKALENAERSKEWKAGCRAALKFATGESPRIEKVYDPRKEEAKAAKGNNKK